MPRRPLLAAALLAAALSAPAAAPLTVPDGPSPDRRAAVAEDLHRDVPAQVLAPAQAGRSTAAGAASYAFLDLQQGRPTRWNPCRPVPWTFHPQGAPPGGLKAVQAAVGELGRRTGLVLQYQGTSTAPPDGAYLRQSWKRFRPLLVGWTTSRRSDLLAGRGPQTVGMTRVLWTGSYDADGTNRTQIASGVVALNAASPARTTGPGSWYTYALHELGHAVGLSHVADASQLMNPVIGRRATGYGAGDVAGLRLVGRGAGCLPDIR